MDSYLINRAIHPTICSMGYFEWIIYV